MSESLGEGLLARRTCALLSGRGGVLSDQPKLHWAMLALASCASASGGDWQPAVPLAASAECLARAMDVIDDLEEDDAALWPGFPNREALLNAAIALLTFSFVCLKDDRSGFAKTADHLPLALLRAGAGQQTEVEAGQELDLRGAVGVARQKSGGFTAAICSAGARLGGADDRLARLYYVYGFHVGMMCQLIDDVVDFPEDLARGRSSVPVAYYRERARLHASVTGSGTGPSGKMADETWREAARSYAWLLALVHRRRALRALRWIERHRPAAAYLSGCLSLDKRPA